MNNKITQEQLLARFGEQGQEYATMMLQNGVAIVVSRHGGRIYGPFLSPDQESLLWIPASFADAEQYAEFCTSGDWNVGGDRMWIAPEIQYNVGDRTEFWSTYDLPADVDPGNYLLSVSAAGEASLSQDLTLEARNIAKGTKQLHLERHIKPAADPLRKLGAYAELIDGVVYAGYEQVVNISEATLDHLHTEIWALAQLNPGGILLIPASPRVEYSDYYEPMAEDVQTIHEDHVRLKITGDRRYKVGYKAAHVFGRLGYFNHFDDGRAYLVIRNFFSNPSVPYAEEPADLPGVQGHSIHVYNDGGDFGGFGELEVNGQTIGGDTGVSARTEQLVMWVYVGEDERIKEIALHLLGVEI